MAERKLATIRKIAEILAIPGADRICSYRVDGWWVVDHVGKYELNSLVIYLEVDSWCPTEYKPELSKGKEPRVYNDVKGEKLKTIRLRGQISQGLLLPISACVDTFVGSKFDEGQELSEVFFEGNDVSEILNIQKYDPPMSAQLAGLARGNFPSRIPKTDQARIQNIRDYPVYQVQTWEVTEKLEGSSMTVYLIDGEFGVCSRNLDLKRDENNTFWKVAIQDNVEEKLRAKGRNIAIQAELIGEGIHSNIYKIQGHEFRVFDVYDIDKCEYYIPQARWQLVHELGLKHAPVLGTEYGISNLTVADLLAMADADSVLGVRPAREGIVFKSNQTSASFKVISNAYLLKQKD